MAESRQLMKIIEVTYECDICSQSEFGVKESGYTPYVEFESQKLLKFIHKCSICGTSVILDKKYPFKEFVKDDTVRGL